MSNLSEFYATAGSTLLCIEHIDSEHFRYINAPSTWKPTKYTSPEWARYIPFMRPGRFYVYFCTITEPFRGTKAVLHPKALLKDTNDRAWVAKYSRDHVRMVESGDWNPIPVLSMLEEVDADNLKGVAAREERQQHLALKTPAYRMYNSRMTKAGLVPSDEDYIENGYPQSFFKKKPVKAGEFA